MSDWNERLAKWADKLEAATDKTVDFASAEIPEYVREVLLWNFCEHVMIGGIFLFLAVLCGLFIRPLFRALPRWSATADDPPIIVGIALCFCGAIGFTIGTVVHTFDAVKVKVAPRVVIVEKIQSLAKGK